MKGKTVKSRHDPFMDPNKRGPHSVRTVECETYYENVNPEGHDPHNIFGKGQSTTEKVLKIPSHQTRRRQRETHTWWMDGWMDGYTLEKNANMNTKSLINGVNFLFLDVLNYYVLSVSHMFGSAIMVSLGRINTFCRP